MAMPLLTELVLPRMREPARIVNVASANGLRGATAYRDAHRAELAVFTWTLRSENAFLPEHLRVGDVPQDLGDALAEARQLLALGVDGLITDSPDHAAHAIAELQAALV